MAPPEASSGWCWNDGQAIGGFKDPDTGEKVVERVYFPKRRSAAGT